VSGEPDNYDEFGMLGDNAAEAGLVLSGLRRSPGLPSRSQTARPYPRWHGRYPAGLVLLHGGGQNAHTWDTVALALGRPLLASTCPATALRRRRTATTVLHNAEAVASVIEQAMPAAALSSGCRLRRHAIRLAATRPDLVRRAVIVDVTPNSGVRSRAMTPADRGRSPWSAGRPRTSLRGNGRCGGSGEPEPSPVGGRARRPAQRPRLPDGRWTWRYDLFGDRRRRWRPHGLWRTCRDHRPVMLVLGDDSKFTGEQDVAEFRRLLPTARVEVVPGAGHAIQSDQPLLLTS